MPCRRTHIACVLASLFAVFLSACAGADRESDDADDKHGHGVGSSPEGSSNPGAGDDRSPRGHAEAPLSSIAVHLVPQAGVSGSVRVNFAVPLQAGQLADAARVRVLHGGAELASAGRVGARSGDGSARSVQLQVELDIRGETDLTVALGQPAAAGDLTLVPVSSTLVDPSGTRGPRVWALLPAEWLSASGAFGPQTTEASVAGTPSAAWSRVCDYAAWDVNEFLKQQGTAGVWLYDRGTVMYRGYARQGSLVPLESAYRETAIYRSGISGSGASTELPVPGKRGDLKYYYAQNLAIHYLLSGDDRFRESAEAMADAAAALWPNPGYKEGRNFWTERHAGFALLAYVWAAAVSDDKAPRFIDLADKAVAAYRATQDADLAGDHDGDARCFAHHADAHGEDYGYFGCSPWMSAILADGLDAYARERDGGAADGALRAIVKLGRMLARSGRDTDGRPFYWMGVGTSQNEVDEDNEHWGESAYVIAMAWLHDGKRDPSLKQAADELVRGFGEHGRAGHMRSFNWQCRSAVATPWYLQ
jgi:hypothetical protein